MRADTEAQKVDALAAEFAEMKAFLNQRQSCPPVRSLAVDHLPSRRMMSCQQQQKRPGQVVKLLPSSPFTLLMGVTEVCLENRCLG